MQRVTCLQKIMKIASHFFLLIMTKQKLYIKRLIVFILFVSASMEDPTKCPLCFEVMKNVSILACGHSFCRKCILDAWFIANDKKTCPTCNANGTQVIQNRL